MAGRWIRPGPLAALAGVTLAALNVGAWAAPAKAAYARIALPPAGEKVMLVKFRGEGDSPIRNVLVADRNLNGVLEPEEAITGKPMDRMPKEYKACTFEAVRPPAAADGATWSLGFMSYRFTSGKRVHEMISYSISGQTDRGDERWTYLASGAASKHTDPGQAPLIGATGQLALKLQVKPDEENPAQTGFGVEPGWPTLRLYQVALGSATNSNGAPQPVKVSLTVTDAAGRIAHQADVSLMDLGFG